jgi:hypothetical protein
MLSIIIQTIEHSAQRYETVGDWYSSKNGADYISISAMQNVDYEFLVAIHELIEAHLCRKRGISEEAITEFDKQFEEARVEGNIDEPGDSPLAPYQKEHQFATKIERQLAEELGVNWEEYDRTVNSL